MGLNHLCEEDYKCPDLHKALLKAMMVKIEDTFEREKIIHCVEGGTLLGLMREGTFISHDDDADYLIMDKQFEKASLVLAKMCENFKIEVMDEKGDLAQTYTVKFVREKHWDYMLKIYVPDLWVENTKSKKIFGTPTIDFFSFTKAGDNVKLTNHKQRLQFKNCFYKKEELFPLVKRDFDNLQVYSPNNPMPFLYRYYGKDCMTKVKMDCRQSDSPMEKDRNSIVL
jgi:phosphorylcholine metabolism protein LicD